MVDRTQLSASKHIQQRTGTTFHLATRVLPRRVRHPTYVLYAFFRIADEVVDGTAYEDAATKREAFERLRAGALGGKSADDPVLDAFAEVRATHGIDPATVDAFLDAMERDVDQSRYPTHEDLEAYMDGSATAVGEMMMSVMDVEDPETARPHAKALAEAFQLTNFLRDVREDVVDHGRIYLPLETLEANGASPEDVENLRPTPEIERAVRTELHRTESLYRKGVAGIEYLPDDCQFAVLVSAVLYAEYHRAIRGRECDVLSRRPSVSRARQIWVVARTAFAWKVSGDPESVFERVSAIPSGEGRDRAVHPADPSTT
ncbi:MAG: phytoene/squalene synthase family protein [Halanaeroarchaeum sp.]